MTGESPVPSQPLAADPFAVSGGVPLPQETTVPPSEVASLVERTGPWIPADTGQPAAPAPLLIAGRY